MIKSGVIAAAALIAATAMGSNVAAAKDLPDLRFSPIVLVDDTGRFRQGEDRTITLGEPVLDLALALQSGASGTSDALARRRSS